MAVCEYHPDRPGIGVCVRCRNVICAACCTKLDGINHCHACLKSLAARAQPAPRRGGSAFGAALVLGGVWLALWTVLWLAQGSLAGR